MSHSMTERVKKTLDFIQELEKLKAVTRQNRTLDGDRWENSAEHSWHVAMIALFFKDSLPKETDIFKVVKMLLIHDVVEIDTGDVYAYDVKGREEAKIKEAAAAERLYGLLPEDIGEEYRKLWLEFEARETLEAKVAAALDVLQPLINHDVTGRRNRHGMTRTKVTNMKRIVKDVSPDLWAAALHLIDKGVAKGLFIDE